MKKSKKLADRGAGRTSLAMLNAPRGAVFVWCNAYASYPKALARFLGRTDLKIETPGFLEYRYQGLRVPVVIDHALIDNMTHRQRDGLCQITAALAAAGVTVRTQNQFETCQK